MRRISSVAASMLVAVLLAGYGSNGYNGHHGSHVEESFAPRTVEEIEAQALADYDELRDRGSTRAVIIAGVRASAVAIVADDATGVGVANDALLIPLALGTIATSIFTNSDASAGELARSLNRVVQRIQELATT